MNVAISPAFHPGELRAQQQAGALEKMATIGPRVIRDFMPEQHRQFFEQLPFLVLGSQDQDGQPWASILTGAPGFIRSPDEQHLQLQAQPHVSDPLHGNLRDGALLGLLGIEPHTRRRNRANGVARAVGTENFGIDILQSFGNCPKYIQAREPQLLDLDPQRHIEVELTDALTPAMQTMIRAADTFFIATAVQEQGGDGRHGVDVSHRGGKPGFVGIEDAHNLIFPDFVGNFFFNTIGNLLVHPRSGLLFVDFASGDLLYLAATAQVIWDGPLVENFAGAQRAVRLHVTQARLARAALPLRWSAAAMSPFLEPTGSWGGNRADR